MHLHGWLPRAGILEGISGHRPHSPMSLLSPLAEHLREVEVHKTFLDSHLISLIYNITNKAVWLFSLKASGCGNFQILFYQVRLQIFVEVSGELNAKAFQLWTASFSMTNNTHSLLSQGCFRTVQPSSPKLQHCHSHCCVLDPLILGGG